MKKKKILFISTSMLPFPPSKGGAVQALVKSLVDYNEIEKKFQIEVASIPNKQALDWAKQYKLMTVRHAIIPDFLINVRDLQLSKVSGVCKKIVNLIYCKYVCKLTSNNCYDYIVFENEVDIVKNMHCVGFPKKILHLHNDPFTKSRKKTFCPSEQFDAIFGISNYICNLIKKYDANSNVKLLYNGICLNQFQKNEIERAKIRSEYRIRNDDIVFVFAARIVKEKGLLELIKAFNDLAPSVGEKAVLLIAGNKIYGGNVSDEYMRSVQKECKRSPYRIVFTGYVPHDKIGNIYSAADVGCLPTMWEEPLSLSVIEYMAEGLPVIISDAGGMVELFRDNCGYIIKRGPNFISDMTKIMSSYIMNRQLIKVHSMHAEERAKDFSEQEYCKSFYSLISDLGE